jgi:hypothetical protein
MISAKDHFQQCDSDIFEGFHIRGRPGVVILGGKIVM